MEVMRIFKSKTLAMCVGFWIAGVAVGHAFLCLIAIYGAVLSEKSEEATLC